MWALFALPPLSSIPFPLKGTCEKYTARTWLKPNVACSNHLRLYCLVRWACHELRNSPKFNSDGKVMKDSEQNSAVNLEIALILSHNWQGEIGIVKMSFHKVEHFQSDDRW